MRLHSQNIALLALFGLTATTWPDYLPTIGPAPLRFQSPPKPSFTPAQLPPLDMGERVPPASPDDVSPLATPPSPALEETAVDHPQPTATSPEPAVDPGEIPAIPSPAQDLPSPNVIEAPAAAPAVAPQLFLQYFQTNHHPRSHTSATVGPFQFTPPPSTLPPPSSTATYNFK